MKTGQKAFWLSRQVEHQQEQWEECIQVGAELAA